MFHSALLKVIHYSLELLDKARLGKLVHKKTATAVAITDIRKEDHAELENLVFIL
jgi:hypothetical protein